jgi:hypothetical protein
LGLFSAPIRIREMSDSLEEIGAIVPRYTVGDKVRVEVRDDGNAI